MKRFAVFCLLIVCSIGYASVDLQQITEEYIEFCNSVEESLNKPNQWLPFSSKPPGSLSEYVKQHADLGICFKGHMGIYFEEREYMPPGIWYCRDFWQGKPCPYHVDTNFPNGIPKKS